MKKAQDSELNFIDRAGHLRAEFVRCNCQVLDDKAFGPLAAVAIVVFGRAQGFLSISGFPVLIPSFCFESRQNFPNRERAMTVNLRSLTRDTLTKEKREVPMTGLLTTAATLTTLKKMAFTLFCCTLLIVAAPAQTLQQIKADPGNNTPPPPGAILDLNGQPIPTAYRQYTVQFRAAIANTAITFAFRNDPSFTSFTNASVTDVTNPNSPGPNLLLNGDFSLGTVGSTPVDWTY